MNNNFKKNIRDKFPYPIALEYRRLNTTDYLEKDTKRLFQLLEIAERTIHFIALIGLIDLSEHYKDVKKFIPSSFKKEFDRNITRTTFGKWIALFRETVKIFKSSDIEMHIVELTNFFIKENNKEAKAQTAFNKLSVLRNKLAHSDFIKSKTNIKTACEKSEELLTTILSQLTFITEYNFLSVDNISVKYHKWKVPEYDHAFAEVIGDNSEFIAYKKIKENILHSPAVIIKKDESDKYLNLSPFILFSEEGSNKIADIFLYKDWDKNKTIKYRPVMNGGDFNLIGTKTEEENVFALLKIQEFFNTKKKYGNYKSYFETADDIFKL